MERNSYPLERTWVIWEMWNTADTSNYASNMQQVGKFGTMWDFLQHWENLPHSQPNFYFSNCKDGTERRIEGLPFPIEAVGIFVENIMPAWEDPVNAKGSDLNFRQQTDESAIKEIWKKLVFSLVGETIPLSEEVVGIRIVDKTKSFKCEVWVKFNADERKEDGLLIKNWMVQLLGLKNEEVFVSSHERKIKMRKIGPAWSIQGRHQTKGSSESPGPGAYSTSHLESVPTYSISRSNRSAFVKNPDVPGPGSYSYKTIETLKSVSIGSSERISKLRPSDLPGPGNYDIKSLISEGPKFSLIGRPKPQEKSNTPGPGHYENRTFEAENSMARSFSREKKNFIVDKHPVPGPGSYNVKNNETSVGIKIGNESRNKSFINNVPGPGSYNLPSISNSKCFSMAGKIKIVEPEKSPGPGIYNISPMIDKKAFKIGKEQRFKYFNQNMPGPGTYDVSPPKSLSPILFGSSNRDTYQKANNLPGPGHYEIKDKIKEGPAFSIRPKIEAKIQEAVPGPGHYDINFNEKIAAAVFPKSKRIIKYEKDVPGPGQYLNNSVSSSGWKFGKQERLKYKTSQVPGPGSYNAPLF